MRDCKGEHCTHYHGKKYPEHATSPTLPTSQTSHSREPVSETKESLPVIRSPTLSSHVKTSSKSSADPSTSERPYRLEIVLNTSKAVNHTSVMSESVESLSFTTSVPTEAKVKTLEQSTIQSTVESERRRNVLTSVENRVKEEVETFVGKKTQTFSAEESSPLPTQNTNRTVVSLNKMSRSQKNISSHSGDSKKSNREQIIEEKPLQHTVAAVASSGKVPTSAISKSSESDPSFLETNVSSILPTSASTTLTSKEYTSGINLAVKPTREKSPKRRKNGERVDRKREKETRVNKQKQKILKTSRKSNKKSAKESSSSPKENAKKFEVSKSPYNTSESRTNISNHFSENFKNERSDKEQTIVEKLLPQAVTGSQDVPTTALVKPSEPDASSSETKDSSALPTLPCTTLTHQENTSEMNPKEIFTLKPTGKKSAKRRKHGEREPNSPEMETVKSSKKLRKAKKKTLENQSPPLKNGSLDGNKQVIKTAENETQVESKLEGEGSELEKYGNKKQNELLPGNSRKRSKKPSNKRSANRNSKKRSKQRPTKRPRPSQISEGGVAKSKIGPPAGNGVAVQEELSPSEP